MSDSSRPIPGMDLLIWMLAAGLAVTVGLALIRTQPHPLLPDAGSSARSSANWPDMRIELNRAGEAELTLLPGIGPALARRIVEDRTLHGAYESIDGLDRVEGIGPATVELVRSVAFVSLPAGTDTTGPDAGTDEGR